MLKSTVAIPVLTIPKKAREARAGSKWSTPRFVHTLVAPSIPSDTGRVISITKRVIPRGLRWLSLEPMVLMLMP